MITKNSIKKSNSKTSKTELVTDFGTRKINKQNLSRTVVLPKIALSNCGNAIADQVQVQLVQKNGESFLKLIPICAPKKGRNSK